LMSCMWEFLKSAIRRHQLNMLTVDVRGFPYHTVDPVFQRPRSLKKRPQRAGYPAFAGFGTECAGKWPYSAGLAAPDEAVEAVAFFSTMRTAMMAPS